MTCFCRIQMQFQWTRAVLRGICHEVFQFKVSYFVLGSNVSLCHLCLPLVCDFSLPYFRRNTISTSSRVFLLDALFFWNV